jgi:hypothetical protein
VTADAAREKLESAIWHTDPPSIYHVRAILDAADAYANDVAAAAVDAALRRTRHDCRATVARQDALIAGDGKHYGSTTT